MKIIFPLMAILSFAAPIVLAAVWIRKSGAKKLPVIVGALTFFVFVGVLEAGFHALCLNGNNAVSAFLKGNIVAYGIYGGLAAGIFEETGRFVAFKTVLRKLDTPETSVAYGIGHGGMEVILLLGVNYIALTLAAFIGGSGFEAMQPMVQSILAAPYNCLVAIFERVFAVIFHISASVIVFCAARDKKKLYLYPTAILLHAVLDFPALLCQAGIISLAALEIVVAIYALAVAYFAKKLYDGMKNRNIPETE